MSVKGQGQMQKKMLNFTLSASICYPFDSHKIRLKYLVIEVQANFQKSVHWAIIQVSPLFFFQTLVLSLNNHKSYFIK